MPVAKPSILIVGAGPAGLTAAIELVRRGYAPRIIEADKGPHKESRAIAINPRTLDILEPSGATARLLKKAIRLKAANIHGPHGVIARLDMNNMPHKRRYMLALPQADTERVLIETLGGRMRIEWDTRLVGLKKSGGKFAANVQRKGRKQTLKADIVIGADGAHSTVRKQLGIGFAGAAYEHDWSLVDVLTNGALDDRELHVFDVRPEIAALIPIGPKTFRVVSDGPDALQVLPSAIKVKKVIWKSRFRISHRQVETCQKGNAFLVGDAAHIHSPVGGRGMNLGIEDAAWLAYLIERGETGDFTRLRHPVARDVLKTVDSATRFVSSDDFWTRFLRRKVLPVLAGIPAIQRRALRQLGGLATPPPPWLNR